MPDHAHLIREALYQLTPKGRVNHPLRDPALEALAALVEQYQTALAALRIADREASIAHDAIYHKSVEGNSRLHDNEDELSAQSAIWRLHHAVRPLLEQGRATSAAIEDPVPTDGKTVGERQGRQPAPAEAAE